MVDRGSFTTNDLTFVDQRVRSHAPIDSNSPLPENWEPDNWSVICGRGKECFEHFGNKRFRILIEINFDKYTSAKTKLAKSLIVMGILDTIRDASRTGGFVKLNPETKRWFEVGDAIAREKIGQQLRLTLLSRSKKSQSSAKDKISKSKRTAAKRRVSDSSSSTNGPRIPIIPSATPQTTDLPAPISDMCLVSDIITAKRPVVDATVPQTMDIFSPLPFDHHEPTYPALIEDIDDILDFDLDGDDEEDFLLVQTASV